MTYAADIWFTPIQHSDQSNHPLSKRAFGSVGFANKLVKVQHAAALHITGALRSTATDLLDAHADLLPIRLTLDKQSFNATLRLLSLPPDHPLHPHILKASCRIKRFKSPLHNLLQTHNLKSGEIETICPSRLHPSWMPTFDMFISQNEDTAIAYDKANTASIQVYADGSSIDGGVGAAAVLYINGTL